MSEPAGKMGLILKRSIGQEIVIGDGDDKVVITLVDIPRGHAARIGIKAPPHIMVYRRELYDELERERAARLQVVTR